MTRILITAAAGCILTGGIGYLLLPVLRALKAGQSIREIGPTWHNSKAGTPMMAHTTPPKNSEPVSPMKTLAGCQL